MSFSILRNQNSNDDETIEITRPDFVNETKQLGIEDSIIMATSAVMLNPHLLFVSRDPHRSSLMPQEFLTQFGLNKKQFNSFLHVATRDFVFTCNNQLYTQIDSVAMGSPSGPSYTSDSYAIMNVTG